MESRRSLVGSILYVIEFKPQVKYQNENMKKYFLGDFPSADFLNKILIVNKPVSWKSFSKICRSESILNCSPAPHV